MLTVEVDKRAKPFRERLKLDVAIDDNLVLKAHARSFNKGDEAEAEVHDLEFGLEFPRRSDVDENSRRDDGSAAADPKRPPPVGGLTVRANVSNRVDHKLVPGELLYSYDKGYFDTRREPPQYQDDERLYYQPCAVCGRVANDPLCKCASDLRLR